MKGLSAWFLVVVVRLAVGTQREEVEGEVTISFAGEHGDIMSLSRARRGWNDGGLENSRKLQQQVDR